MNNPIIRVSEIGMVNKIFKYIVVLHLAKAYNIR
jgi:hypothetical protein